MRQLGGLQLDKDLRHIVAFVSACTNVTVRDKFVRLIQMAILLNLEEVRADLARVSRLMTSSQVSEIHEYWGSNAAITWRLAPAQVRRVLNLRSDFAGDDIRTLRR